jgi:hypothetical protein
MITETQEPVESDTSSEAAETVEAPPSWRDDVPEDYREEKTLSKYQSVGDLAKGHVHLSRMMGNSVKIPGEDGQKRQTNMSMIARTCRKECRMTKIPKLHLNNWRTIRGYRKNS